MRFSVVSRYAGIILLANSIFILIATLLSYFTEGDNGFYPLLLSFLISATVGVFPLIFTPPDSQVSVKEIYAVVVISWATICTFGVLPYVLWGGEFTLVNAWFESVSGYTTTGSTILSNIEGLPPSLLFFRSCTHWIGGVGVVLFALLIAPALRINKMRLSRMEMSSLAKDNFMYKTHETMRMILTVYVGSTVLCLLCLKLVGMGWFDAINQAFSTCATGGFSTKNNSIASFHSTGINLVLIFFMLVAGLHFGLVYSAITGRSKALFTSPIVRYYLASILIGVTLITTDLWFNNTFDTFGEALLHSAFQVVSIATTTGYATANSAYWPSFTTLLLIFFMMQTACAGSTVGGMKVDRVYMLFKALHVQIKKQQHPNAIIPVKIGNVTVDEDVNYSVILFMLFFLLIAFVATLLLCLMGLDIMAAFSAALASLTNAGAGFSVFGSFDNYNLMPPLGKILLTLLMVTGRLEIYGLVLLFFMRSWK